MKKFVVIMFLLVAMVGWSHAALTSNLAKDHLVGWWKMDDNTTNTEVLDFSGYQQTGVADANSATLSVLGKVGRALEFDPYAFTTTPLTGNVVSASLDTGNTGLTTFSVAFWYYPTGWGYNYNSPGDDPLPYSHQSYFASTFDAVSTASGWNISKIYSAAHNKAVMFQQQYSDGTAIWKAEDSLTANLNQWIFIVITFNGTSPTIWVDGTSKTVTNSTPRSGTIVPDTGTLSLGNRNDLIRGMDGRLDQVMYFDTILTEDDIVGLYNSGNGISDFTGWGGDPDPDPDPDTTPPTPDPMTWATVPYATGSTSVRMIATTATDDTAGVRYLFENVTLSTDSGWVTSPDYTASGLNPETAYSFRVKARDTSLGENETGWSSSESATTLAAEPVDTTPPSPDPMTWATAPHATSSTSISMTATTATDPSGVQYYFENVTAATNSGWRSGTSWVSSGLTPDTQYTFRVKARDLSDNYNETAYSTSLSATTDTASMNTATQISRHDITWYFDGEYEVGYFANGDPWVVSIGGDVGIVDINPRSVLSGSRVINGTMVNPDPGYFANVTRRNPQSVATSQGDINTVRQGWDSSAHSTSLWDASLNRGRPSGNTISAANPLVVTPTSSVVSCVSVASLVDPWREKTMWFDSMSVLTVLDTAPPEGSFRPSWAKASDGVQYNISQIDWSKLRNFPLLDGTRTTIMGGPYPAPPLLSTAAEEDYIISNLRGDFQTPNLVGKGGYLVSLQRRIERMWLFFGANHGASYLHPRKNMAADGAWIVEAYGMAALMLNTDEYTQQEKAPVLYELIQKGIDIRGIIDMGPANMWPADGQINPGRRFPPLFAGHMLSAPGLSDVATMPMYQPHFAEDTQCFLVTQTHVDLCNESDWYANVRPEQTPILPYESSDVGQGMSDWSIRGPFNRNQRLNKGGWSDYRRTNSGFWHAQALTSRIMGIDWGRNAYLDYCDRWMSTSAISGIYFPLRGTYVSDASVTYSDWALNMWDAYRWDEYESGPTLNPISDVVVMEDDSVNFVVSATNDTGATITYSSSGRPSGSSFGSSTGAFSWASAVYNGGAETDWAPENYNITFTATDSNGSHSRSMDLTVTFLDSDNDGLPDAWEIAHFGNLNQGPNDDYSGDGFTNMDCFLMGLDPTVVNDHDPSIVGYYMFDDDPENTVWDSSTYANHGFTLGGTTPTLVTPGIKNSHAYMFDGVDDAVWLYTTNWSPTTGSVALWFNIDSTKWADEKEFLFGHAIQPWSNRIQIALSPSRTLQIGMGDSATKWLAPEALALDTDYHVALTWNSGAWVVYVDGVAAASGSYSGLTVLNNTASIGNHGHSAVTAESFGGLMDDVYIYNRALHASEVADMYFETTNRAPIVDAGADQAITLPVDEVVVAASASDDGLPDPPGTMTYLWAKDSGPAGETIINPNDLTTRITFVNDGTYVFSFTADDSELTGTDTVKIVVNPAPSNTAPVVYAGIDQEITWPADQVHLSGQVTDDGLPDPPGAYTVLWAVDSGPQGHNTTFSNSTSLTTSVTFDQHGVYVISLTADDSLLTGSDTVTITVNEEVVPDNQAPVVDAGPNQIITWPTKQVTLSSTATDDGLPDPPGALTYSWAQVAGPGTTIFSAPAALTTVAEFSTWGVYIIRLTVNDSALSSSSDVQITVNESITFESAGTFSIKEGELLQFDIAGTGSVTLKSYTTPTAPIIYDNTVTWTPTY